VGQDFIFFYFLDEGMLRGIMQATDNKGVSLIGKYNGMQWNQYFAMRFLF
jgi:hypothetical protein